MSQMKLSEIWDKADKELTQVRRTFGKRSMKETCAKGAITYYSTKGKYLWYIPKSLIDPIIRFERRYGEITFNNDTLGWTFKQFADAARAIGE